MHPLQSRLHCYSHKRLLGTQYRTENPKIGPDTIPTAFRNASGQTDNYYFTNWYLWSNLQNVFTPNDFCNRLSWESGSRRLAQTMHTDCSRGQVLIFVLDSWTLRTLLHWHCSRAKNVMNFIRKRGAGPANGWLSPTEAPQMFINFIEQLIKRGQNVLSAAMPNDSCERRRRWPFGLLHWACKYAAQY